jgi:hypothetical protein
MQPKKSHLVISLLTLLVRVLVELLTLFFHQSVRELQCCLGEFVFGTNCRWLLRMSVVAAFEKAVMERMIDSFRFFNYCYLIVRRVNLLQFSFVKGKNKITDLDLVYFWQ